MMEILWETLIDNAKLFPFLFLTYLFIEYVEHHTSDKLYRIIRKTKQHGPFIGGCCAIIPQCGFSLMAANLYAVRLISLGTLMSIFLATSDETLPILISNNAPKTLLLMLVGYKMFCGILFGYAIDAFTGKNQENQHTIVDLCAHEHCHCDHSILRSALYHSLKITAFIFVITLLLNILFFYIAPENIMTYVAYPVWEELVCGLFGLFPNCSSSVILTQLYLEDCISINALITGSLANSGAGLLVLCKVNRPGKQNMLIVLLLLTFALLGGLISHILF